MILWKVTFRDFDGQIKEYHANSKTAAVRFYLNDMKVGQHIDRSEYKIWKNNKDYTATLNRFLSR